MSEITSSDVVKWLRLVATTLKENSDYLTELDSAIGDADHGINMKRGFEKVESKLDAMVDKDIGTILKTAGMSLIGSVGGASGPLYGTFFIEAGKEVAGKDSIGINEFAALIKRGLQGILKIGKAQRGDKTMVDALIPAIEALETAIKGGSKIHDALKSMVEAAHTGMKNTIPMLAKKGRASYLGDRSIGHQDPGATSLYLILKSAYDAWHDKE